MKRIHLWLRAFFNPRLVERELREEIRHHLEMETEKNIRNGMDPRKARRKAMVDFGGEERYKEQAREERKTRPLEDTLQDLRYGIRQLRKQPGFTLVALLSLALGIGANTAIFSMVNGILLRPLPYPEADRIVVLSESYEGGSSPNLSPADFLDLRSQAASFSQVEGYRGHAMSFLGEGGPVRIQTQSVSPDFFAAFGVEPVLGRFFRASPEQSNGARLVVLSYGTWQTRFGGEASVLGRSISLSGQPHTVVGVAPPGFGFPDDTEAWVRSYRAGVPEPPVDVGEDLAGLRNLGFFRVVARLAPDHTMEEARAELQVLAGRLAEIKEMQGRGYRIEIAPLREELVGDVRPALLVLMGAVGLVLLIACANVANLLLARAAGRRQELAVRTAMGASRGRLLRQLLAESVLLGGLAGLLGLALARWGFGALLLLLPAEIPRLEGITLDGTVLTFTLMASLATGVIFGLLPALDGSRSDPAGAIREGGRGGPGGPSARSRELLVVAEVALSVVLLAGTGLLLKSLTRLQEEELGFDPVGVLTTRMSLPESRYPELEDQSAFAREILAEVEKTPGVASVGLAMGTPFGGGAATLTYDVEGIVPEESQEFQSGFQSVSRGYFKTMGVPLLAGRSLGPDEEAEVGSPRVLLVNEALALRHWGSVEDAVGKRVRYTTEEYQEVVGVVGDFRQFSLDRVPRPEAYASFLRDPWPFFTLVVKTEGDPRALIAPVRNAVLRLDPEQPVYQVETFQDAIRDSVGQERFTVQLLSLFASIAMGLALMGVYGVMAYVVSLRTREIGIRVALGAPRREILWFSLRGGVRLAILGLVVGIVGSLGLNRLIRSLLYGVSPWDGTVLVLAAALVTGSVLAAAWLPARRAAALDPAKVLRQ